MRRLLAWILSMAILTIGVLILTAPLAQGQSRPCEPLSGTVYYWFTDTWHGVADLTIGGKLRHANWVAVNTGFFDGGDIWIGTEDWTVDFGHGNAIRLSMNFVTEHMNDAVSSSGVFHVVDIGKITKGTGMFRNASGNLSVQGPFGPNVKLPDNIQPPPESQMFGFAPVQGIVCGLDDRD